MDRRRPWRTATLLAAPLALTTLAAALPLRADPPPKPAARGIEFTNDVVPILTRLGCNQGACHGQQSGKGGFKLSLRGWDPAFDHAQLTKEAGGRRADRRDPSRSLILLKATGRLPHGGGTLLAPYSEGWKVLDQWLRDGAKGPSEKERRLTGIRLFPERFEAARPGASTTVRVVADYDDGSKRDVTALSRFQSQNDAVARVDASGKVAARAAGEASVLVSFAGEVKTVAVTLPFAPPRKIARTAENPIDRLVEAKAARLGLVLSPRSTDTEFLRRVTLDVCGVLPTPDEVRAFTASRDPQKRAKWIDALLERPEYADTRALRLSDLLRVNGQFTGEEGAEVFGRWIREQVAANVPYDRFVAALMTARGSTFKVGAANFFRTGQNAEDMAETTAQAFLGTRIACAKCHNHPFERWKQSDYYGLAAFFARYGLKYGPEFGETEVVARRDGEAVNPRTKKPARLRVLGGADMDAPDGQDRRTLLARWLTAPENPLFAKVAVNRVWGDLMGRGVVEPVDDFRISNPPSNPELLDALAEGFVRGGYDVKALYRTILNSETYQRSSVILPGNARDDRFFARAYPRRIPAEALLDAIGQVTLKPERFWPYPAGFRAAQVRDSRTSHYFLEVFGRPKREVLCACERSDAPNLSQSLHLINSAAIQSKLAAGDGRVAQLLKAADALPEARRAAWLADEIYLLTLGRLPSPAEAKVLTDHVAKQKDRRQGVEDALWALLNAEEFLFQK